MVTENYVSSTFRKCIGDPSGNQVAEGAYQYSRIVVLFLFRQGVCTLHVIDVHNGFFALLGTVAVAFFTFALFDATRRLWQSAEDQRNADDIARREEAVRLNESIAIARENANAAKLAADAALAANRPWLIADFKVVHLTKTPAGLNIGTHIEIRNIGNSPATNIFVSARFMKMIGIEEEMRSQMETCQQVTLEVLKKNLGTVVFPNDSMFTNSVSVAEIGYETARFVLAGCVSYMFSGSDDIHRTGFILGLSGGKPQGGLPPLVPINVSGEGQLPDSIVSGLSLHQMLYGAFAN